MLQWVKMERASLSDIRVKRLIADLGMKGFGLYAWMFIYVSCNDDVDINIIQNITEHMASRKIIRMVLHDYNLFEVNDDGSLHVCARASVDGGVRAPEPFKDKEREKNISSINKYAEKLKKEEGEWRETVCMNTGFSVLLMQYWEEAVEAWRIHAISFAHGVRSCQEAKYYFNTFVKHKVTSQKLREHLQLIDSAKSHPNPQDDRWL